MRRIETHCKKRSVTVLESDDKLGESLMPALYSTYYNTRLTRPIRLSDLDFGGCIRAHWANHSGGERKPASGEGRDAHTSLAGDVTRSALVIGAELSKVRL
jgi:hypothetical protein